LSVKETINHSYNSDNSGDTIFIYLGSSPN